ncbi:hypothetical protein HAX54_044568, partial [Datura stramonium]|nr:hypothetical protein [Datura stramonium]
MIERGILNNRVVAYEEREVQMRQAINDNHTWLQNSYLSMGQARDQVLGLARRAACIHHNHNHQNDRSVGRQARALVLQLPAVFQNWSKGKAAMADKDTEVSIIDQSKNPEEEDSGDHGEVLRLRQQLAEWHRAWVCGLPPPVFPTDNSNNPPNLRPLSQAQFSISADPSPQHAPGYTLYHLYPGTSTVHAPTPQHKINSYPAPPVAPSFIAPPRPEIPSFTVHPSIVLPRSASEPIFNTQDVQTVPLNQHLRRLILM